MSAEVRRCYSAGSRVLRGVDEVVAECRLIISAAEGYLIYPRDLEERHLYRKSGRWCIESSTND